MVTSKKKDFVIFIAIATAISILLAALTKLLQAYGKYKIDCAKAYSIKKSAHRKQR
jgi:hypothetical protein